MVVHQTIKQILLYSVNFSSELSDSFLVVTVARYFPPHPYSDKKYVIGQLISHDT